MICNLLRTIELLEELQYWIDNWTHCNAQKRYANFERIAIGLWALGAWDAARVAEGARSMSIMLPFKESRFTARGNTIRIRRVCNPNPSSLLKTIMVTP